MRVYRSLTQARGQESRCVVAVGNFDGVHRGHQAVFAAAAAEAACLGSPAVVLTFSHHPILTLSPQNAPSPLMTLEDRLAFASALGADAALVLPFEGDLAAMAPREFARTVLAEALEASALVAGEGWRFGRGRTGDLALLGSEGRRHGYRVRAVPPVLFGGAPVSSTRVREALSRGDVALATDLLGRPYYLRGTVVPGQGIGRRIGFPTINLDCGPLSVPARGVYAGAFSAGEASGPAAINVGTRPTVGGADLLVEAHLPGFSGDLAGREVAIVFGSRLRDERKFPDRTALAGQIAEDVERTVAAFDPSWPKAVPR